MLGRGDNRHYTLQESRRAVTHFAAACDFRGLLTDDLHEIPDLFVNLAGLIHGLCNLFA